MTLGISDQAKIAEVDGVGPNPKTPQHDGVQRWCDLYPTQPFGGPHGWRRPAHQGDEARGQWLVCSPPPWGLPLYSGEGVALPLARHLEQRPRERWWQLIRLKCIYNFLCFMLVYTPFALCFVTLRGIFMHFLELTY
jgi:hypothetical protein